MPANPLPCGCAVHCPLHAEAAEMRATLTDIESETTRNWNHYSKSYLKGALDRIHQAARAAIARAENAEAKNA